MYEQFFGLEKKAFSLTSDPSLLFLNEGFREALAGITYTILGRKGLMVLTGDAGTGKSTLLARIRMHLPAKVHLCSIMNPTLTVSEFLEMVLLHFGIAEVPSSKTQRLHSLHQMLAKNREESKISVLVVDEAHKVSAEVFEEIRLLGNLENPDEKLLQVLLAGQPELTEVLNRQDMRQLKQRIAVRLRIQPLAVPEVGDYITCRWRAAGGPQPLPFTSEAVDLIARHSRGIPRLINSLSDNSLLLAFAEDTRQVTEEHVRSAATDLDLAVPPDAQSAVQATTSVRMSNGPAQPTPVQQSDVKLTTLPPVVITPFRSLIPLNESNTPTHVAPVSNGAHELSGTKTKPWWARWTTRRGIVQTSER